MKKLLSLLATVSLVSTATASVVACGNGNNGPIDDNDDNEEKEEESEQDISTIIDKLDLGEIIFHSLDGSDFETKNAISEQIRTLNPNVGGAQINISNIDRINNFATISIQGYTGTVTVSFIAITPINLLITDTDLGDINFYSLTGNDTQTQTEIINQIRTLNPNVGGAQINISNIDRINNFATISIQGYTGTVTVSFIAITSINLLITDTDLGDINFYSLTGNDTQTQTEIINQIRTLNPNVGDAQINISNIDRINNFATISIQGYTGTVTVSFIAITSINVLITYTDLGDINFYSFSGNDTQTQTEIINQVRTLNPNAGDEQINISNINPIEGTATISALGFNGALTITFTPSRATEPLSISFPSTPRSMIELQNGTILVAGGFAANGSDSFLASVDLSNSEIRTLAEGSDDAFPSIPQSMIQLQDGTILVAGGTTSNGSNSFLATVDLSDPANPQIQTLAHGSGSFPSVPQSMIQLQDGTILIAGGVDWFGDQFLASVNLFNSQIQILAQGPNVFPANPQSITQLQDGTILVAGGNFGGVGIMASFLASVDLFDPANPQIQIVAQGQGMLPPTPRSIIELQDGTILVVGGSVANGSDSLVALVDLSNSEIRTLAQGPTVFPSTPSSVIQLQDGTILVVGGNAANGSDSFLRAI